MRAERGAGQGSVTANGGQFRTSVMTRRVEVLECRTRPTPVTWSPALGVTKRSCQGTALGILAASIMAAIAEAALLNGLFMTVTRLGPLDSCRSWVG